MQIPDFAAGKTGLNKISVNPNNITEPSGSRFGQSLVLNKPQLSGQGRASAQANAPEGVILDLDWNRIRRFVQRFSWQANPPKSIEFIRDYWSKRDPIFNKDGDRAELNFDRPTAGKGVLYGPDIAGKTEAAKPKTTCNTCSNRKYMDKSNDSSVSYQTPTKLNPRTAAMAVGAHEREHITNERAKADREGRKVISQSISMNYSVCPECNIMYTSGGTARTKTISKGDDASNESNAKPEPGSFANDE